MAYEIVYWPGFTGRAEPAILLLEDVGAQYTVTTNVPERIAELAPSEPIFACPLLIDGETVLSQTSVITQYLAQRHGCDVTAEDQTAAAQFGYNLADIWRETYEGRRDGNNDYLDERFPLWLNVMEASFRGQGAWFFPGARPSWLDYLALNIVTLATYCWGDPAVTQMAAKPRLAAWTERMLARRGIRAYLDNGDSLPVAYPEVSATG
ncbi:MAG: hypothetical protein CMQ29_02170 [Gammaproteobacteria bacterium]|nr:hypothetical protein [Gammaproteobacteria bacterium]